mgnify:FL=1
MNIELDKTAIQLENIKCGYHTANKRMLDLNNIIDYILSYINYIQDSKDDYGYITKHENNKFELILQYHEKDNPFDIYETVKKLDFVINQFNQLHNSNYRCIKGLLHFYDWSVEENPVGRNIVKIEAELIFTIKEEKENNLEEK